MTKKEIEEQLKKLQAELTKLDNNSVEYPEENTAYYFIGDGAVPFSEGGQGWFEESTESTKYDFLYGNFHKTEEDRDAYRAFIVGASVFWNKYQKINDESYDPTKDTSKAAGVDSYQLEVYFTDSGQKKIKEVEEILARE